MCSTMQNTAGSPFNQNAGNVPAENMNANAQKAKIMYTKIDDNKLSELHMRLN